MAAVCGLGTLSLSSTAQQGEVVILCVKWGPFTLLWDDNDPINLPTGSATCLLEMISSLVAFVPSKLGPCGSTQLFLFHFWPLKQSLPSPLVFLGFSHFKCPCPFASSHGQCSSASTNLNERIRLTACKSQHVCMSCVIVGHCHLMAKKL